MQLLGKASRERLAKGAAFAEVGEGLASAPPRE
jgi:hypothetical protein